MLFVIGSMSGCVGGGDIALGAARRSCAAGRRGGLFWVTPGDSSIAAPLHCWPGGFRATQQRCPAVRCLQLIVGLVSKCGWCGGGGVCGGGGLWGLPG